MTLESDPKKRATAEELLADDFTVKQEKEEEE